MAKFRKILINTDKIKPEEIEKKESSIRPEEIILRGEIKNLEDSPEPWLPHIKDIKGQVIVEITLDKITGLPLLSGQYTHKVFLFVDGFSGLIEDFFQGIGDGGVIKGGEDFAFGSWGDTAKLLLKELRGQGYLAKYTEERLNEVRSDLNCFQYSGTKYPVRLRIYLGPRSADLDLNNSCLVYFHIEPTIKQDLGWVKIVRLGCFLESKIN